MKKQGRYLWCGLLTQRNKQTEIWVKRPCLRCGLLTQELLELTAGIDFSEQESG